MESKKILVIEDDTHLLKSITKVLLLRGYQVIEARDGIQGLDALEQKPDLIWLDLYLPNMDGLEFLDKLRGMPAYCNIPIVVATVSRGKDDVAKHAAGVNVVDHFIKSEVTLASIIDAVDRILS